MNKQSIFLIINVNSMGLEREINCMLKSDTASSIILKIVSVTRTSAFDNMGKATYLVITEEVS